MVEFLPQQMAQVASTFVSVASFGAICCAGDVSSTVYNAKRLTNGDAIDKEYRTFATPHHIIGHRGDSGFNREYLVKWMGLPYSECSWEISSSMPGERRSVFDGLSPYGFRR